MLSSGETRAWIEILDNATLATIWTAGVSLGEFEQDRKTFYATTRALEIISEASRRLSETQRAAFDIPWREVMSAGNVYRHNYESVEQQVVWTTVKDSLPPLIAAARLALA